MEDVILIGGGGHCKSVIDSISKSKEYKIIGILDLHNKVGDEIFGVKVIGTDDKLEYYYKNGIMKAFLTMGSIGDTRIRRKLYSIALNIGYFFPNIIDNTAIVSDKVEVGHGNFIGKGAIINAGTKIGSNCIINTGAIIEHDCNIESFCHIAPGTTISGNVVVGENTHIGTNSAIIQNIKIGRDSVIGAGSVVITNIGSNVKAYGSPCKEVKK
ncbi:acetyltransferase [Tissierella carlieri]|uniref:acetyltransferase n=1 Tax=Tissierella carlieri TaxID=689904 RepID=UPI001C11D07A|nr:acetyltransferase [Tissierella carlieri]MBU5310754.1 acetyltransferase [Tissierella carlieri]